MDHTVKVWCETVTLPTYECDIPQKNPMFLEKRVYQGSSGAVYPHPVIEGVADTKVNKNYQAYFIENAWLKIMILPELGGRVHRAWDKTRQRDFVYYNSVIKPALVGLTGPWISGGIEFNWPQHHRPSTFQPLDVSMEKKEDGSATVWVTEIEQLTRTEGHTGFTLYPGKAYLEVTGKIHNRTPLPQTFLWWANPAVKVNDHTQSIFPPDVYAVFDHGKRDVSDFPIATGTYYKVDYSPGTDISRYKNIPVPTSYMAIFSRYDFIGCYEHDTQAGMLHVANHHISPGKKQWTWGNGDFGKAWDKQLTDDDGPYVELMTGMYTDNQPDFSWLMPGERKEFKQYFLPYAGIGEVKNATQDLLINVSIDNKIRIGLYSAGIAGQLKIIFWQKNYNKKECRVNIKIAEFVELIQPLENEFYDITVTVFDESGNMLIHWQPEKNAEQVLPAPAMAALRPEEVESLEQLWLTGLHLEQYRHATYNPEDYWLEALRRDATDTRCNIAMGILMLRRGQFTTAEKYLRTAIAVLTARNPNPADGWAHYYLGYSLDMQGREEEAYAAYYKSFWNDGSKAAAWRAIENINERRNINKSPTTPPQISFVLPHTYMEHSLDYAARGEYDAAIYIMQSCIASHPPSPMMYYYMGYFMAKKGDENSAKEIYLLARHKKPDYCFPWRNEEILILQHAITYDDADARAPYYLGNLWYAKRQYAQAIDCWEKAALLDSQFPTVHRNLALAYFNKKQDSAGALSLLEKAFALDDTDARVLMELDQLYKILNYPLDFRLSLLQKYLHLVNQRDDLYIEFITLHNLSDKYNEAIELLMKRNFHPWEGGEGKVTGQYVLACIELAKVNIANGEYKEGIIWLHRAMHYPANLGEGKLKGKPENDIHYFLGRCYVGLRNPEKAREYFIKSTRGISDPLPAIFYNDPQPDSIFYQALAYRALQDERKAFELFQRLIDFGKEQINKKVSIDYFAVSLPDLLVFDQDIQLRNTIHCYYVQALGQLGLGKEREAADLFYKILSLQNHHVGAMFHQKLSTTSELILSGVNVGS